MSPMQAGAQLLPVFFLLGCGHEPSTGDSLAKAATAPSSSPYDLDLASVGATLYFIADDGSHGYELWMSDGTTPGTSMVKDVDPGSAFSLPDNLMNVGGTLFFTADDGVHGRELWKTDGTSAGTQLLKDIRTR